MAEKAKDVWADGAPGTPSEPDKARIRAWGTYLESFVTAIGANAGTIYETRAALYSDLDHAASTMGWVVNDPQVDYNGIYQKLGVPGSGSWTRLGDLPYSFISAIDAGAGTPNAILATSELPISSSALVILNVFEANTGSPVTVAFNGGSVLTIKTNSGNNIAAGGLVAGMQLLGVASGSTFRIVSDQASAAIVAAAEAAASAASTSATNANTSAVNAATSESNAQKWAANPEDVVVSGGLYSAFHWAQKAAAVVTGGIATAIHAATLKSALDDGDELGASDSAAAWGLKKFTLANLITSIFKASRTIANAVFDELTFALKNASGFTAKFVATGLTAARQYTLPNASGMFALTSDNNVAAWVNFNGTGTVAIRGSKNVSSITDNGTGNYTVNFASPLVDANFAAVATAMRGVSAGATNGANVKIYPNASSYTASSIRIGTDDGTSSTDMEYVNVIVAR